MPGPVDVTTLLTDAQLDVLRGAYDADAMNAAARAATALPFPPAAPFADFIIGRFYTGDAWPPARRELVLIALGAANLVGNGRTLAVHLYWGLMEGLGVGEIADTLLLVGAYAGVDKYSAAMRVLRAVIEQVLVPAVGEGGDATSGGVMRRLGGVFP